MRLRGSEEVHHGSRLEIRVWHRSQTKAKRRKAHLVGSASALLGEVVKRQGDDRRAHLSLSLSPICALDLIMTLFFAFIWFFGAYMRI